jgi:hypothetical protein
MVLIKQTFDKNTFMILSFASKLTGILNKRKKYYFGTWLSQRSSSRNK